MNGGSYRSDNQRRKEVPALVIKKKGRGKDLKPRKISGYRNRLWNSYGGGGKTKDEVNEMRKAYIQARLSGENIKAAGEIAGYADGSAGNLAKPASGIIPRIRELLIEKGIDEEWFIKEIVEIVALGKDDGSKFKNLHASFLGIRHIGELLGHGRTRLGEIQQQPAIAVQINNNPGKPISKAQRDEPRVTPELVAEVRGLLEAVREEIKSREAGDIPTRSPEVRDSKSCNGVVDVIAEIQDAGSGGSS